MPGDADFENAQEDRFAGQMRSPTISLVVARSRPGNVIGHQNRLPWHLRSDLRRFRAVTLDHAVIMGRKTFDSIGQPLPRRLNIVVSASAQTRGEEHAELSSDDMAWVSDIEAAMTAADAFCLRRRQDEYFVIGGQRLFREFLDRALIDRVYLTEVLAPSLEGDTHFAEAFSETEWAPTHEESVAVGAGDDYPTVYRILERRPVEAPA